MISATRDRKSRSYYFSQMPAYIFSRFLLFRWLLVSTQARVENAIWLVLFIRCAPPYSIIYQRGRFPLRMKRQHFADIEFRVSYFL